MALGALLAGGAIFWILMSVAGVLMQREWGALVDPREMWVRVAMFAVSVPLAILSPWAAGLDGFAAGIAVAAFLFVSIVSRSPVLGAGIFYVCVPIASLIFLRGQPDQGLLLTLWALASVWATDIGAYFAGRSIGGPKMAPAISPGKTWSGLAGGVVSAVVFGFMLHFYAGLDSRLAAGSGLLAVVAQLGDLFESWLKRRAGVKDSGKLLPGHGGVMDRLDGVVPVLPIAK